MSASVLAAMTAACRFCSFVSFLHRVSSPYWLQFGRDQPNHFLALFIGEQCENNKENRARAKFANGVVPFLILIVKNVSNRHSVWVIEDQGGGWEINAVSREVVFVLVLVVFESHPVTQTQDAAVYIHMSIQRFGAIAITGTVARLPPTLSSFLNKRWRHFQGEFIFNLCRNFALILIISVGAENTAFLWICGRDAAARAGIWSNVAFARQRLRRDDMI
jgi:hypothetical protein